MSLRFWDNSAGKFQPQMTLALFLKLGTHYLQGFLIYCYKVAYDAQQKQTQHEFRAGAQPFIQKVTQPEKQKGSNHQRESPGRYEKDR
jgi:hypothetical protein